MARSVAAFYAARVRREWRRLDSDSYSRLEWLTTQHFMATHMPKRGRVLDAGGGPGRYTLDLARRGYTVTLLDLVPDNLAFAARAARRAGVQDRIAEMAQGSVVDLARYADNTFDAVLCLGGALSHNVHAADRARAAAELVRVARPGAPIFVSVISRLGFHAVALTRLAADLPLPYYKRIVQTGDYTGGHGFTACHFYTPEELQAEFTLPGVEMLAIAGLEGVASVHRRELNKVGREPRQWRAWLETHFATCTHPAAVGISELMLLVARKQ